MSSDYIPRLRSELLRAGATEPVRRRWAYAARGLRPVAAAAAVALVAVAVVLAWPAGGGDDRPTGPAAGGVRLTYGAGTEQTAQVVRERLAAAGIDDASVSVSAGGRLTIVVPAAARADVTALVRPGRLAIYDWERSVLGARGTPAPADTRVTGGDGAGDAAALTQAEAEARGQAVRAVSGDGWFALGGDPTIGNTEIARAHAGVDPMTREPIVVVDLTARGEDGFAALTRSIAHRGRDAGERQHLAIVIDDKIVAVPYIDYRQAPNGIPGSAGLQISGGLTRDSARVLAALLSAGPLTVTPRGG